MIRLGLKDWVSPLSCWRNLSKAKTSRIFKDFSTSVSQQFDGVRLSLKVTANSSSIALPNKKSPQSFEFRFKKFLSVSTIHKAVSRLGSLQPSAELNKHAWKRETFLLLRHGFHGVARGIPNYNIHSRARRKFRIFHLISWMIRIRTSLLIGNSLFIISDSVGSPSTRREEKLQQKFQKW